MKNVLIILGHPNDDSLSHKIAESYRKGALEGGANVDFIHVRKLDFEPILFKGYKRKEALEPDILDAQKRLERADHVVFIYPNWWGTYPAMFKGFIDKLLWPGFAFRYRKNSVRPEKLMKGKSVRIFITMDNPWYYYRYVQGGGGIHAMKHSTLGFCGFSPIRFTILDKVRRASAETIAKRMKKIEKLGKSVR